MAFVYSRHLHFYETDAMGIIHHATSIYLMEEARVTLLRHHGIQSLTDINYPVIDLEMKYVSPLYFEDEVSITVRARKEGARLIFEYELATKRFPQPVAFGKTVHVAMDMKTRKPIRLPASLAALMP